MFDLSSGKTEQKSGWGTTQKPDILLVNKTQNNFLCHKQTN
jgi:hypothetical protein